MREIGRKAQHSIEPKHDFPAALQHQPTHRSAGQRNASRMAVAKVVPAWRLPAVARAITRASAGSFVDQILEVVSAQDRLLVCTSERASERASEPSMIGPVFGAEGARHALRARQAAGAAASGARGKVPSSYSASPDDWAGVWRGWRSPRVEGAAAAGARGKVPSSYSASPARSSIESGWPGAFCIKQCTSLGASQQTQSPIRSWPALPPLVATAAPPRRRPSSCWPSLPC